MGQVGGREGTGRQLSVQREPHAPHQPDTWAALRRGLTRRCAVCGQGGLFRGWFRMLPQCPRCGFRFERESGHWVGSLGINTVVSFGLLLVTLVVGILLTAPDIAVVPILIAGVSVAVLAPLLLFPFSRTLWSALDLVMRPLEAGELPADPERGSDA